ADHEPRRLAERDTGDALRHLPGHELATAARALVIEEDPRAGEQAIALTVVDRDVVAVDLRDPVRATGMKGRRLALRRLRRLPEHLARAGLIEARVGRDEPHGLEHSRHTHGVELGGEHRLLP